MTNHNFALGFLTEDSFSCGFVLDGEECLSIVNFHIEILIVRMDDSTSKMPSCFNFFQLYFPRMLRGDYKSACFGAAATMKCFILSLPQITILCVPPRRQLVLE
jgi:hypothetical protein